MRGKAKLLVAMSGLVVLIVPCGIFYLCDGLCIMSSGEFMLSSGIDFVAVTSFTWGETAKEHLSNGASVPISIGPVRTILCLFEQSAGLVIVLKGKHM